MLANYILTFPSGSLLTGQLLKKMYEYPKELIHYIFADYSDGVISGLEVNYRDGRLFLSSGVYKHDSALYVSENEMLLEEDNSYEGAKHFAVFKVEKDNEQTANNIIIKYLNISIKKTPDEDDIILFSFKNRPVFPRYSEDIMIHGNVNLLDYKHSCYGKEPTFMPALFQSVVRKEIESHFEHDPHPLNFVMLNEILSKGIISCEFIREYINLITAENCNDLTMGKELMIKFLKALRKSEGYGYGANIKKNANKEERKEQRESWLVD